MWSLFENEIGEKNERRRDQDDGALLACKICCLHNQQAVRLVSHFLQCLFTCLNNLCHEF